MDRAGASEQQKEAAAWAAAVVDYPYAGAGQPPWQRPRLLPGRKRRLPALLHRGTALSPHGSQVDKRERAADAGYEERERQADPGSAIRPKFGTESEQDAAIEKAR